MRQWTFAVILLGLLLIVGCTSSTSSQTSPDKGGGVAAQDCEEPENPYDEGTGHYAGYEWAENNGSPACSGSSQSFIEGCEEYEQQESEYEDCEEQNKK